MRIFMLLFVGAGLLACAQGIRALVAAWRFSQRAQEAAGVVTGIVECRSRSGGMWVDGGWMDGGSGASVPMSICYPVVRFRTADGREVETRTMMGTSFKRVRDGDPVTVLYDPDDPTRAQLGRSRGIVIVLGVAHCLLGAASCVLAFLFYSVFGAFGSVGG